MKQLAGFKKGKTVILPIDHGTFIPVPGLEDTEQLLTGMSKIVDGFIVNLGMCKSYGHIMKKNAVYLRCDIYRSSLHKKGELNMYLAYGSKEAKQVGADGMISMCFPGNPNDREITLNCTKLISDGLDSKMPVIIETLPFGLGKTKDYTFKNIEYVTRVAVELGADVIKTAYTGNKKNFAQIVERSPVPVVILGGAHQGSPRAIFKMVEDAISVGAAGIMIGRNVWQDAKPLNMAKALNGLVHKGLTTKEAMELYKS